MKTKENIFYIVKSTSKFAPEYYLFNGMPRKISVENLWYRNKDNYHDGKIWSSNHSYYPLYGKEYEEKFKDIDHNTEPVPVRLVPTDSETPDLYVQRYKDCLFINTSLVTYVTYRRSEHWLKRYFPIFDFGWDRNVRNSVPHNYMISNKLFPEITEKSGIVKMNIERIAS